MAERWREGNRWDAVINGVNYRLKRDEGAYRKVSNRSALSIQQMLNQAGNQYTSRDDLRTLFQTDWSGGSTWHKPLLSDQSIDTYYVSRGFDMVTEPGNIFAQHDGLTVVPTKTISAVPSSVLQVSYDEVYHMEPSGTNIGLIKWNGATWAALTNDTSVDDQDVYGMCWDAENGTVFILFENGQVGYVTPDTAGGVLDAAVATAIGTPTAGSNIFMHFGRLMVYNGTSLLEIADPLGTELATVVYTDGMGPDACEEISRASTDAPISEFSERLAIASSEGIWIVKNVEQEGGVTPFITRIDRTNEGTNIGIPVATLPPGTVVLDIAYHLGSLVMSTASDMTAIFGNDISSYGYPLITLYHLTNDSLGTIGVASGTNAPDESPYKFLTADGSRLYIGGAYRVWTWDAIRGGLHVWLHDETVAPATYGGFWSSMVITKNAAGAKVHRFSHTDWANVRDLPLADVGGKDDTHSIESNYLDGNLPAESKSLVGVTLMTDGIKTNETWTVSIETDDGSFASVAAFTTVGAKTSYKALVTAKTGYRFRYKIAWTATADVTAPSRVKGIVLHMVQGQMVTAWQLTIDGSEVQGIENDTVRPEVALGTLETLAGKQTLVTYVDEFRVTSSTHDVRVDSVQVVRSAPQEIDEAIVVLTEQNLDN